MFQKLCSSHIWRQKAEEMKMRARTVCAHLVNNLHQRRSQHSGWPFTVDCTLNVESNLESCLWQLPKSTLKHLGIMEKLENDRERKTDLKWLLFYFSQKHSALRMKIALTKGQMIVNTSNFCNYIRGTVAVRVVLLEEQTLNKHQTTRSSKSIAELNPIFQSPAFPQYLTYFLGCWRCFSCSLKDQHYTDSSKWWIRTIITK